jgi:hypothetical protein
VTSSTEADVVNSSSAQGVARHLEAATAISALFGLWIVLGYGAELFQQLFVGPIEAMSSAAESPSSCARRRGTP